MARGLLQQWSPEQISRRLVQDFADDHSMRVSHETIYRSLFIQTRGVLKKQLVAHLRRSRGLRRARHATARGQGRGQIAQGLSIRERPAEVQDRAVPGHWEGDLIAGAHQSYIATLVERHSRFVMLVKVHSKDTVPVTQSLAAKMRKLPAELPAWFTQLDSDRDAQLGLYEWRQSGRPLEEFQRMDRNDDGFLTAVELLHSLRAGGSPADPRGGNGGPRKGPSLGAPGKGPDKKSR